MPKKTAEPAAKPTSTQGDGDPGTRSGQPNTEDVPSHPTEHMSGYGGAGGAPRTSSDKRESPKP